MTAVNLFLLFTFSAFSANLLLQCGLGINTESRISHIKITSVKLGIIFLSVVFLWSIFTGLVFSIFSGIFIYIIIFPVSFMTYEGLENLIFRKYFKNINTGSAVGFPGGITAIALFICLNISGGFLETLILVFGFTSGILLVNIVLCEIQKRAALEAVPRFLRGKPLILISMGLLSLVFTKVSILIFRVIGL